MAAKKAANKAPQSNPGAKAKRSPPSAARGSKAATKSSRLETKRQRDQKLATGAKPSKAPGRAATTSNGKSNGGRSKQADSAAARAVAKAPKAAVSAARASARSQGSGRATSAGKGKSSELPPALAPKQAKGQVGGARQRAGTVPAALPNPKGAAPAKAPATGRLMALEKPTAAAKDRVLPPAAGPNSGAPKSGAPKSAAPVAERRGPPAAKPPKGPDSERQAEELDGEQAAWEAGQREVDEERRLAAELGEAAEDEEEEAPEEALLPSPSARATLLAQAAGPTLRPRRAPPGSPIEPLQKSEGLGLLSVEELWDQYQGEVQRLKGQAVAAGEAMQTSTRLQDLRNELIERHYPLVRYHAERLLQTLPKSIELDDLISAGQFGLMDAIRGFDMERGIKFKTYCSTRIRGSILDMLRSQDWVPRLVRLKAARIERALQKLIGEYGREPTHAELARQLEMDPTDLSKEMREAQPRTTVSLSDKWDDDDGAVEKVEIIEDHDAVDPVNELNRRDQMLLITRSLSYKERFIIEQYYQYGHTMREIGEMLGLTESRVCQIHSNVMGRLKDLLEKRDDTTLP
jgi:RNA polymerase sigma factor for flagellar operon FliA